MDRYRDPVHGFIDVRPYESEIINSEPFQRLRNIKQLAMTYLVFHGAEHTRFGHSLGVMHLVTKSFRSVVQKNNNFLDFKKRDWYEQILRLIALTHDIGHAPFSHASEIAFPEGLEHEDFTEKIIKETYIADIIRKIGLEYINRYGEGFDITPELICDIYMGKNPGENSEFTFLKSFMDSELDCDKMDYLLRDSLYCGVNYGKYDVERLISSLTVYIQDDCIPRLAISHGGIQAFEEFVLARYFMFVQVYFHRTRRYFDIMLNRALEKILPNGKYPDTVNEYLKWDDCKVLQLLKEKSDEIEDCSNIIKRKVYPRILETKTHPNESDMRLHKIEKQQLFKEIRKEYFIEDSADKIPHKIPTKTEVEDEKAIVIIDDKLDQYTTISEESHIIKNLTEKINIERVYVRPEYNVKAIDIIKELNGCNN